YPQYHHQDSFVRLSPWRLVMLYSSVYRGTMTRSTPPLPPHHLTDGYPARGEPTPPIGPHLPHLYRSRESAPHCRTLHHQHPRRLSSPPLSVLDPPAAAAGPAAAHRAPNPLTDALAAAAPGKCHARKYG
ncbi:hypothetical protein Vafri_440, partial [Volvox africanus]